jgi:hypothetical protein
VPTFFEFSQTAITIQDHVGHFIRRAALGVLEEMRVDLERDRRSAHLLDQRRAH